MNELTKEVTPAASLMRVRGVSFLGRKRLGAKTIDKLLEFMRLVSHLRLTKRRLLSVE